MPQAKQQLPEQLRVYDFHGLDLRWKLGLKEAVGDCPWCGREGKFGVLAQTGQWKCIVCAEGGPNGGGNATTFLRLLWAKSDEATNGESEVLAKDRGLLLAETLMHWGVVKSILTGEWLIPGYNVDGSLCQLYKRIRFADRWELRPTPTIGHYLHGVPLYDKGKSVVWLHESWGNALAFWEVMRAAKRAKDGLVPTSNDAASLLADANVLSVANCGAVGKPLERFLPLFAGKRVVLCFDSDHPREHNGLWLDGAGFAAAKRAALLLSSAKQPPASIEWLKWGEAGFDPDKPNGWDVRDLLNG